MTIYLLIIIYLLFSIFIKVDKNKKIKKYWIIFTFFILSLISALRAFTVGVDTIQYYSAFKSITFLNWNQVDSTRYEIGFFYLNKLISLISNNPQIFLAITSFLIIPPVGYFIYKRSKNVALSTLLYVLFNIYFFHMTGMRQSLAVALLLISIMFLEEKKYIKFSIFVILASLFHSSALIFFIALLFDKFDYKKRNYIITIAVMVVSFICFKPIFLGVANLLGKYAGYMENDDFGVSNYFGAFFQFLLTIAVYTFCHIIFCKIKKNGENKDIIKTNEIFIKLLAIDVICQCMAMKMNIIGRMNQYFWIYSIILIPNIVSQIKSGKTRLTLYTGIIFLSFIYWLIIGIYRPEWNGAIPYTLFK